MNHDLKLTRVLLALISFAGLAACSMDTSKPISSSMSKPSSVGSSAWVVAPQKHNNSGIGLRYRIDGQPTEGKPLTVNLEFSGVSGQDAQVQVDPDKALSVQNASKMQKSGDGYRMSLSKGDSSTQTLVLTPDSKGMHYIRIQMSQDGRTSMAGIAIPVGDGPFSTPTIGEVQTTSSGEKIIVMPAK
jgi:hypothetical protein